MPQDPRRRAQQDTVDARNPRAIFGIDAADDPKPSLTTRIVDSLIRYSRRRAKRKEQEAATADSTAAAGNAPQPDTADDRGFLRFLRGR